MVAGLDPAAAGADLTSSDFDAMQAADAAGSAGGKDVAVVDEPAEPGSEASEVLSGDAKSAPGADDAAPVRDDRMPVAEASEPTGDVAAEAAFPGADQAGVDEETALAPEPQADVATLEAPAPEAQPQPARPKRRGWWSQG